MFLNKEEFCSVIWNSNTEYLQRLNQITEESDAFPSDNISGSTSLMQLGCLSNQNFWSEWKVIILLLGYLEMDNSLLMIIPLLRRKFTSSKLLYGTVKPVSFHFSIEVKLQPTCLRIRAGRATLSCYSCKTYCLNLPFVTKEHPSPPLHIPFVLDLWIIHGITGGCLEIPKCGCALLLCCSQSLKIHSVILFFVCLFVLPL